jgi:hypothetical protein
VSEDTHRCCSLSPSRWGNCATAAEQKFRRDAGKLRMRVFCASFRRFGWAARFLRKTLRKLAPTGYRGTEFPILRYSLSHAPRDQENGLNYSLTVSP